MSDNDITGLEITQGELRHCIGIDPSEIARPLELKNPQDFSVFLLQEILIAVALMPIIVGVIYTFIILPLIGPSVPVAIAVIYATLVILITGRWLWQKRTTLTSLVRLLQDVERYNSVIKAIQISDEIEAAFGNTDATISDRETVISALKLTREDLLRALRTERILRENQEFIGTNTELFANNLTAIQALQVSDKANAYGQSLDRALQIGVSIQTEMRKLQNQR